MDDPSFIYMLDHNLASQLKTTTNKISYQHSLGLGCYPIQLLSIVLNHPNPILD